MVSLRQHNTGLVYITAVEDKVPIPLNCYLRREPTHLLFPYSYAGVGSGGGLDSKARDQWRVAELMHEYLIDGFQNILHAHHYVIHMIMYIIYQ